MHTKLAQTHMYMIHWWSYIHTQAHTYTHQHIQRCADKRIHMQHTYTQMHTYMRTHTQTCTHMHGRTCTQNTNTCTHTHMYTHVYKFTSIQVWWAGIYISHKDLWQSQCMLSIVISFGCLPWTATSQGHCQENTRVRVTFNVWALIMCGMSGWS